MKKQYLPLLTYLGIFLFLLCAGMLYQSRKTSDGNTSITVTEPESSSGEQDSSANLSEAQPRKKKIAITFDDGPHPVYTLKLLDGLAQRNVKATFFIIGESAERYPEVIKRIYAEGHLIGNHTYSHVQLTCISSTRAIEEIRKTNDIVASITGETVRYIRPPYITRRWQPVPT